MRVRLTRATAADGCADLGDDGEDADPDAGNLEGVGDRQVRVLRVPGRRRGGSNPVALTRPLPLPRWCLLHSLAVSDCSVLRAILDLFDLRCCLVHHKGQEFPAATCCKAMDNAICLGVQQKQRVLH